MSKKLEKLSKFLSLVLRHKPEVIGITLDENGWVDVAELIECSRKENVELDELTLLEIVNTNDKKRFALSEDGRQIRANQGHSVTINLDLQSQVPPDILFHGTASRFIDSILLNGLTKMNRHHVHLTENIDSALAVGTRYGKPVLLIIDAKLMHEKGHLFYKSENNVWLVEMVSPDYLSIRPNN
jgi:putative RNA 2'-phosphotransferase